MVIKKFFFFVEPTNETTNNSYTTQKRETLILNKPITMAFKFNYSELNCTTHFPSSKVNSIYIYSG